MRDREKPLGLPLEQYLTPGVSESAEQRVWARLRARRVLARRSGAPSPGPTLPAPIAEALLRNEELPVARARLWREVRARVHRPARHKLARVRFFAVAALLGALATCGIIVLSWRPPGPQAAQVQGRSSGLLVADGRPLGVCDASGGPHTVRLEDDSELRLATGARLEPLLSSGSRFELLLARGSVEFAVTPGGPRRWLVEAGQVRVEVVGTVFRVDRSEQGVRVSVSRGEVLVRGEHVPGWVKRIAAGSALWIENKRVDGSGASVAPAQAAGASAVASAAPVPGNGDGSAQAGADSSAGPDRLVAPHGRSSLARGTARFDRRALGNALEAGAAGNPYQRYASLGAAGLVRETMRATSIEQLLELADIARLSGHPQDAVAPLTRALDAFRGNRQAALAAFTLGRVLFDQLGIAKQAAEAFERALVLGLPVALQVDCYRRLAEAYGRAGDPTNQRYAEQRLRAAYADTVAGEPEPVP